MCHQTENQQSIMQINLAQSTLQDNGPRRLEKWEIKGWSSRRNSTQETTKVLILTSCKMITFYIQLFPEKWEVMSKS